MAQSSLVGPPGHGWLSGAAHSDAACTCDCQTSNSAWMCSTATWPACPSPGRSYTTCMPAGVAAAAATATLTHHWLPRQGCYLAALQRTHQRGVAYAVRVAPRGGACRNLQQANRLEEFGGDGSAGGSSAGGTHLRPAGVAGGAGRMAACPGMSGTPACSLQMLPLSCN